MHRSSFYLFLSFFLVNSYLFSIQEEITSSQEYEISFFGEVKEEHEHEIIRVSNLLDVIQIEDQSKWTVRPEDRWKLRHWLPEHTVIITQNPKWCWNCGRFYPYKMVNCYDSTEIQVEMQRGPNYDHPKSRWIVGINQKKGLVMLNGEKSSKWEVESYDVNTLKDWEINDTIIVGVNKSWFTQSTNILINVECGQFVRASEK